MTLKCVFMGSPDFAVPVLELVVKEYNVVGVFTQPDRPAGRGMQLKPPAVKSLALSLDLPVFQPEKLKAPGNFEVLKELKPDFIVVAAYGQILKQDVLSLPKYGCINVHASLLPRWRGAAPIQAAIAAGDKKTGVTIMKMDIGMDTGDMIAQKEIEITKEHTGGSLFDELSELGASFLIETLPRYFSGELVPQPQPEDGVTYASMIKKQDGELDFSLSAEALEWKIRAFQPWPGTYTEIANNRLKVIQAEVVLDEKAVPEKRIIKDGWPLIGTAFGWLKLLEVQPAGKKRVTGKEFLNGAKYWAQ
jgi:methionyl-tRNA formyltransferase